MTKWHFTRTPHYSGPDDPAIGQIRGTIALDETVVIETIGGANNDYEAAGFLKAGQIISGASHRRYARPGFATGYMGNYVTCQIALIKALRRTGKPFTP
jgi:hypothetical protein